jgi:LDH2 family malate/lactate/ureidoglycolate dehydrogenase
MFRASGLGPLSEKGSDMAKEAARISVKYESLHRTVAAIFERLGEAHPDAAEGANVLVGADLRGTEIQGVMLLPAQVTAYREGAIKPRANWRIVRETLGTATVDQDRGLTWMLGAKLMGLAIEKARRVGVGIVTAYNGGDAGRIGHYATLAAEQDMVGVVANTQGLRTVPAFGAEPRLGTNPVAIAAPAKTEVPLVFDAATSASALGLLRLAYADGAAFPAGTIAELDGTPVMKEVPPRPVGQYHLLPLGGDGARASLKGYGFGLMVEVLATMLTGTLPSMLDRNVGARTFFAAFSVSSFADVDLFKRNMDQMLRTLRETKPAPGRDRVMYPGLRGHEEAERRKRSGIPLRGETVQWFSAIANELSVPPLVTSGD